MRARMRWIGMMLLGLLTFASMSWGQVTALEGKVQDDQGQPLKGALIKIERTDIRGHYQVKTDKKGHYYYGGLPLGTYRVSVEIDGKEADFVNNVRTHLGDPLELNFDLKQVKERQQEMQKAAETGTLTKEQERSLTPEQKAAIEKRAKEQAEQMKKNKELNDAFNAGREAETAKNWQAAVDGFEKASTIDPTQTVVWAHLADSYINLAGTKTGADQQAAMDKGLNAYQKAIALKPDDPSFHNNYALALVKAKKLDEAKAELTKAATLDPANAAKYYYNLGAVLVNTGQTEQAGEAFKKAIDANPNYAPAQYQYGIYLVSKATTTADGKVIPPDGTIQAFQKYLELDPNGPYAEQAKGMLQTLTGTVQTRYVNPDEKKSSKKKK
jgi:tetratricopeptide (TPR) repeat protein